MKKILLIILFLFCCYSSTYIEIPSDSIRIRIIANSNSKESQKNKKIVSKQVIKIIYNLTEKYDFDDIDTVIINNKPILNKIIKKNINSFSISYGYNFFPEKKYKKVIYKSGVYKSLVITLGKGKGKNYWCSLYPRLCLIKESKKYKFHFLIKDILFKYN